jgi:hypothetical protein
VTVTCPCGTTFEAMRSDARFCSPKCRQKAYRDRGGTSGDAVPDDALERLSEAADYLRSRADRAVAEGMTGAWERWYRALDEQVTAALASCAALGYEKACLYGEKSDHPRHMPRSKVSP